MCRRVQLIEALGLPMIEKRGDRKTDVLGDLTQERWSEVATRVKWDGGRVPGSIAKLLVRTTLSHFAEPELAQDCGNFGGFQSWDVAHRSRDRDILYPNKLRFETWFTIFQQHRDDLAEISI